MGYHIHMKSFIANGLTPFWSDLSCWNIKKIIRKFVILLIITSKIFLYMKKVSLERYYFVLYNGALSLKMSKMVLNPFCDKNSSYSDCAWWTKAVFIIFPKNRNTFQYPLSKRVYANAFLGLLRLSSNSLASTSREEGLVTAQLHCAVWPVEQISCRAHA